MPRNFIYIFTSHTIFLIIFWQHFMQITRAPFAKYSARHFKHLCNISWIISHSFNTTHFKKNHTINYLWNIYYKTCHISGYISSVWNVVTTFCETVRENYIKLCAKYYVKYSRKNYYMK